MAPSLLKSAQKNILKEKEAKRIVWRRIILFVQITYHCWNIEIMTRWAGHVAPTRVIFRIAANCNTKRDDDDDDDVISSNTIFKDAFL
jgi:hypothetical protein